MNSSSPTTPPTPAATSETQHRYNAAMAAAIESRWQQHWEQNQTFRAVNPGEKNFHANQPKYYCLDMFPYPSGAGLHVGHPEGYTATDIISRYKRHCGFNVLHPMGWDAFGLPAEQYAIQTGVHPAVTTKQAIDTFRRQLNRFGFSYDWSREFATIDENYYKWTQWIWLKAYDSWYDKDQDRARPIAELVDEFETTARMVRLNPDASEYSGAGDLPEGTRLAPWPDIDLDIRRMVIDSYRLAYTARQMVNWCPKLGTALANEEVIDGKSERGGYPVFRQPLTQWMFRITSYADRLLYDLALCDWPESTRIMQAQWIGRSEGAEIDFPILVPRLSEPGVKSGAPALRAGNDDQYSQSVLRALGPDIDSPFAIEITAEGFVARDPFPKGEPSPDDLTNTPRHLPHLQLPEATYFISWRCLPGESLTEDERTIVLRALTHWNDDRCRVFAAVVMPDHVHWIIKPFDDHALDDLIESVKRFSAREINILRSSKGSIWDPERFDHIVRDIRWLSKFIYYVARNPVQSNLVEKPSEYEWLFIHPEVRTVDGSSVDVDHSPNPGSESRGTFEPTGEAIRVFTTRPDTIFGATYMVVAPEHPLVMQAMEAPHSETDVDALSAYVEQAVGKTEVDRMSDTKQKTGVFTGFYARNPATGKPIPVWTSDYVLTGYGTGAIMAVPGQDTRDWEFAKSFGLPIVRTVQPPVDFPDEPYLGEGPAIHSAGDEISLNGLLVADAKKRIIDWLEDTKRGMRKVNYKLRDWLFSRQRYWGEPFPIVFDENGDHYPVDEKHLPVKLPPLENYQPIESDEPQPMLAKATDWVNTTAGEAGVSPELLSPDTPVTRETNTMPNWAGSCWYYLRFADPHNDDRLISKNAEAYWMGTAGANAHGKPSVGVGVDLYIGGAEHAVLHLLYARFWHKILFDLGEVSTPEPFHKLFHQGMITSFAYQDSAGRTIPPMKSRRAKESTI